MMATQSSGTGAVDDNKVDIVMTFGAASDDKVGIVITFSAYSGDKVGMW